MFPTINEEPGEPLAFVGTLNAPIAHVDTQPPRSTLEASEPAPDLCPTVTIVDTPPTSSLPFFTAEPLAEITRPTPVPSGNEALTKESPSDIPASPIVVEESDERGRTLEPHPSLSVVKFEPQPSTTVIPESGQGEPQTEAQPSTSVISESVRGDHELEAEPSTSAGALVVYKGSHSELLPSSSVVDIIPTDGSTPEAAKNVPGSVKRYLQRWPRGDNRGDPRFDYTSIHEADELTEGTSHDEDDVKRRADLLQAVPTHVHVSL